MAKGASFEREVSKQLSLWWTDGERDDVFWRSSMSGGRATVRGKQGKATANQYGDITATDSIGEPLVSKVVIELKRGYKNWSVMDTLDSPTPHTTQFHKFLQQVLAACKLADTNHFLLICKRDRRQPIVIMPMWLVEHPYVYVSPELYPHIYGRVWINGTAIRYCTMLLKDFFKEFMPRYFLDL